MDADEQNMGAASMPPFGGEAAGGASQAGRGRDEELDEGTPGAARPAPLGRAQDRINQGMREAADRIELAAERLDEAIEERLGGAQGPLGRAGELGHSLSDGLGSLAGYLRSNDVESVREGLERSIRARPLRSLLIGVAAGWLVGKILR